MGNVRQTLTIVALTASLVSCSSNHSPASTPTLANEMLQLRATTATFPLATDLSIAYSESSAASSIDAKTGNFQRLYYDLAPDDSPYVLTSHLPADYEWAAPIAQDGIAVIVNVNVRVSGVATDTLRAIYQGRVVSWIELGGADTPIAVFSREDGSGTRLEFERMVMGRRRTTANARIVSSNDQMLDAVRNTAFSVGYISLAYLDETVRALTVDGIYPTQANVAGSLYPLRSTIYVIGNREPEGPYRAFFGWAQGPEGQLAVSQRYAPLDAGLTPGA